MNFYIDKAANGVIVRVLTEDNAEWESFVFSRSEDLKDHLARVADVFFESEKSPQAKMFEQGSINLKPEQARSVYVRHGEEKIYAGKERARKGLARDMQNKILQEQGVISKQGLADWLGLVHPTKTDKQIQTSISNALIRSHIVASSKFMG